MTQPTEAVPMDKLARVYLKIRAAMQELTQKYETEFDFLKDQRDTIANAMKDQMKAAGNLQSVRTPAGTVSLRKQTRFWSQDWDEFKKFAVQHNALDLFEHRIAQKNMAEFLEKNPGVVPPGLNAETEIVVSVRKTT